MKKAVFRWRVVRILLIVPLVLSLLSGCSIFQSIVQKESSAEKITDGHVDLSHVVAVVPLYTSQQTKKWISQIAYIFDDGSFKIHENAGMFGKEAAWTKKGIFYSDEKNDYFVSSQTNTIRATRHPKTVFQYVTYALDDNRVMTTYNAGMDEKNNGENSIATSGGKYVSAIYTQGSESLTAGNVGVCENGNSYQIGTDKYFDKQPEVDIYQFSEKNKPLYKKVQTIDHVQLSDFANSSDVNRFTKGAPIIDASGGGITTPCINNWIYTVVEIGRDARSYDDVGYNLGIMKWNVETGKFKITPLYEESGKLFVTPYGDQWNDFENDSYALQGDNYIFVSGYSGAVASVNLKTGVVHEIVHGSHNSDDWSGFRIFSSTTNRYIFTSDIPMNVEKDSHAYFYVHSREGKLIKKFSISDDFVAYCSDNDFIIGRPAYNPDNVILKK